jgi:hypothetical protein
MFITLTQRLYIQHAAHNTHILGKYNTLLEYMYIYQGKAVPLEAWSGPEDSRKLRFPDFITPAQEGGKVVSLKHRPHLAAGNSPGTHFC